MERPQRLGVKLAGAATPYPPHILECLNSVAVQL